MHIDPSHQQLGGMDQHYRKIGRTVIYGPKLYLKDVLAYLLPLLLWKILPRIGKAYYSDAQKTLKSCLITALYVILIREAIEVALYSVAMLLVNGTVWYEAMFGSICITVLEIVVAAFVLKKLSAPYVNKELQDC